MANAEAGRLVDMSTYVDRGRGSGAVRGPHRRCLEHRDGDLFAVPLMGGLEGIVWYPLQAFSEAGYTAPESWDELIDLSEQMVADGRTPWCLEQSTDESAGDPATDWVEALVLRVGGVDLYDRWMAGDVGFDHPTVRQAVAMFGEVVFGEGFVIGGGQSPSIAGLIDSMSADPPDCWMNLNASWMADEVRNTTGADVGFFVLPPLEPGGDAPVVDVAPHAGGVPGPARGPGVRHLAVRPELGSAMGGRCRDVISVAEPRVRCPPLSFGRALR